MNNKFSLGVAIVLSVIALLLSGVAARKAGRSTTPAQADTFANIQKTKKMKVCYAVWPPAVIKDAKTGELTGHDIDAFKLIADSIGASIEYKETTFGNMSADIQSGNCDIGTSLFLKIPRTAAVGFSRPLFYAGNSGLVRKGDTRFNSIDDVDKPGIKVVVATGESGDIYATGHFKNAQITRIDVESSDLSRFLTDVSSGRADIGIADADTIKLFASAHPETQDIFADKQFDVNPDALPMRLGDTKFAEFINNSLLYLQTSGQWDQLEKKYNAQRLHEVVEYELR